jgi:signal recognition particle subunit SRP54
MNKDFTLDDFRMHFENIQKMGMKDMIRRMPGMADMIQEGEDPDSALRRVKGMIDAMTAEERADPDRIDAAGRERIAAGAGVQPEDVGQFLKQFEMVRDLMRRMASMSVWQRITMVLGLRPFRPPQPPA